MDRPRIYQPAASSSPPSLDAPPRQPKPMPIDVRHLVDEVCAPFAPRLASAGIQNTIDVPPRLCVWADPEMLRQALTHLVTNAVEAMPSGGNLVITSYFGRGLLELEVADSGGGLSDEGRARAFEPCYTTKRHAAGMGLALVRRIAQAHGGDVTAANCPEGGAAFTLRIPAGARQAAA
jgi:signal transduction histidine kinase